MAKKKKNKKKGGGAKSFVKGLMALGVPEVQAKGFAKSFKGLPGQQKKLIKNQILANQTQLQQQKNLNQMNQQNPFGSVGYVTDPVTGQITKTTNLSPEQQQLLGQQTGIQQQLGGLAQQSLDAAGQSLSQPFSLDDLNLPAAPGSGDVESHMAAVTDQLYGTLSAPVIEKHAQERDQFEQAMANKGIPMGSDLYNKQLTLMEQNQDAELQQIKSQALGEANRSGQMFFDQQMGARNQAISEALQQRGMSLQEAQQLMGSFQGPTLPQFESTVPTQVGGVDVTGLGSQFAALQNAKDIAGMQASAAGAGGMSLADRLALMNQQGNIDAGLMQLGAQLNPSSGGSSGPSFGSTLAGLGGAAIGSFGSGFGQSYGSKKGS